MPKKDLEPPIDYAVLADLVALKRDADRWRKLTGCGRFRVLGSARLGQPDGHMGIEVWGVYPGKTIETNAVNVEEFTRLIDGFPEPKGESNDDTSGTETGASNRHNV